MASSTGSQHTYQFPLDFPDLRQLVWVAISNVFFPFHNGLHLNHESHSPWVATGGGGGAWRGELESPLEVSSNKQNTHDGSPSLETGRSQCLGSVIVIVIVIG